MSRTLCNSGAEAALPINTGTATSFSEATVVRLTNTATANDYLVTVVETIKLKGTTLHTPTLC